ncbi:MAG TPA: rhodanese-like domain-containing protein [Bacteroidia bacterium]|nr:rhodanese-like domain-containing protein [Bacteroidia bacterium]
MKSIILKSTLTTLLSVVFFACAQNANFKTVSPQEFQKLLSDKNTILVDVRTAEEVSEGKIPNAINIDFYSNTFEQEISKLDKNKTILVYCRSGRRSAGAAEVLAKKGYKVVNLDGGISNWQSLGLPIQK